MPKAYIRQQQAPDTWFLRLQQITPIRQQETDSIHGSRVYKVLHMHAID